MLNIKLIRENSEKVKEALKKRGLSSQIVDGFLVLDEKWRALTQKLGEARAQQNLLSKERKVEEAKILKGEIKSYESELRELEGERNKFSTDRTSQSSIFSFRIYNKNFSPQH